MGVDEELQAQGGRVVREDHQQIDIGAEEALKLLENINETMQVLT